VTLEDNIHALTQPHTATQRGVTGTQAPLITQLRTALHDRDGRGGNGADTALPFSEEAHDLLEAITAEAREYADEHTGRTWTRLETNIRALNAAHTPEDREYLTGATQDWIDQIRALTDPPRPRRKLENTPCPACSQTRTADRRTALTAGLWDHNDRMLPPGHWHIECGACGAQWQGPQIAWLLTTLRHDTPKTHT
jgi:hypothetical protein